jgi:streptomycin 6-kinase
MEKFMQLFQMTADYLEKNTVKIFCASDNKPCDKPIGFYSFSLGKEAELDNFFIDPDYIGQGFGKKMWSVLIEDFKAQAVHKFSLWSDPGAELFYLKMGCIKIGVRQSPMMPNRYPVIFEYEITRKS